MCRNEAPNKAVTSRSAPQGRNRPAVSPRRPRACSIPGLVFLLAQHHRPGDGWVADWAHTLEIPGLMLGLAGTGYGPLRQAAGERVPLVLALEQTAWSEPLRF